MKPCRVLLGLDAQSTGLDTDHLHRGVAKERIEQSDRIRATADTGYDFIR